MLCGNSVDPDQLAFLEASLPGYRIYIWFHTVFNKVYTCVLFKHSEGFAKLVLRALFYFLWTSIHLMAIYLSPGQVSTFAISTPSLP